MNLIYISAFIYYIGSIVTIIYISHSKNGASKQSTDTGSHLVSLFDNESFTEPLLND
jgi:hypothetical protein